MAAEAVAVNEQIGARVRQHRTGRGWTLDDLADRSGVSRRMLITIEHGEGNPSIATLLRIGDALGVGLPVLVDVERSSALTVTAAGQAPVLWRGPDGGRGVLVAESIWPNEAFEDGQGINTLTGCDQPAPAAGGAFHDNRVWIKPLSAA